MQSSAGLPSKTPSPTSTIRDARGLAQTLHIRFAVSDVIPPPPLPMLAICSAGHRKARTSELAANSKCAVPRPPLQLSTGTSSRRYSVAPHSAAPAAQKAVANKKAARGSPGIAYRRRIQEATTRAGAPRRLVMQSIWAAGDVLRSARAPLLDRRPCRNVGRAGRPPHAPLERSSPIPPAELYGHDCRPCKEARNSDIGCCVADICAHKCPQIQARALASADMTIPRHQIVLCPTRPLRSPAIDKLIPTAAARACSIALWPECLSAKLPPDAGSEK